MCAVITKKRTKTASGRTVAVARKNASSKALRAAKIISENDEETDKRAKSATRAAIKKAQVCNNPVAKYDFEKKKAYLEYADGKREYID